MLGILVLGCGHLALASPSIAAAVADAGPSAGMVLMAAIALAVSAGCLGARAWLLRWYTLAAGVPLTCPTTAMVGDEPAVQAEAEPLGASASPRRDPVLLVFIGICQVGIGGVWGVSVVGAARLPVVATWLAAGVASIVVGAVRAGWVPGRAGPVLLDPERLVVPGVLSAAEFGAGRSTTARVLGLSRGRWLVAVRGGGRSRLLVLDDASVRALAAWMARAQLSGAGPAAGGTLSSCPTPD